MSVQQDLLDLGDLFNFCDLSTFTQHIPVEWVAPALDLSSQACGFHGHPATYSMNIRPLIPR
ncbi:hypothetical protein ABH905_005797 [Pseudomonas frederiksbergensis]|uniref:hypothetical protein n=1 Tax=Pseudomonas frederiksbergensis TaxID=104087 RepID=UPI003D1B52D0